MRSPPCAVGGSINRASASPFRRTPRSVERRDASAVLANCRGQRSPCRSQRCGEPFALPWLSRARALSPAALAAAERPPATPGGCHCMLLNSSSGRQCGHGRCSETRETLDAVLCDVTARFRVRSTCRPEKLLELGRARRVPGGDHAPHVRRRARHPAAVHSRGYNGMGGGAFDIYRLCEADGAHRRRHRHRPARHLSRQRPDRRRRHAGAAPALADAHRRRGPADGVRRHRAGRRQRPRGAAHHGRAGRARRRRRRLQAQRPQAVDQQRRRRRRLHRARQRPRRAELVHRREGHRRAEPRQTGGQARHPRQQHRGGRASRTSTVDARPPGRRRRGPGPRCRRRRCSATRA